MSDLHTLPLVPHDLPVQCRPHAYARRSVTGHLEWFWSSYPCGGGKVQSLHGPFLTCADAHKSAVEWLEFW